MNTVFQAKKILTMNPSNPTATHVAVSGDKIIAVGSLEDIAAWGPYNLNETFLEKVIMPGFVEGHSHSMEGTFWKKTYCGYFDRKDPNGKLWEGSQTLTSLVERLKEEEKKLLQPEAPLSGWGVDPIYFSEEKINRQLLDKVSKERPIGILNASGHIMYVNTKALELGGLARSGINHPGIPLDEEGLPAGELRGPEAMVPLSVHVGLGKDLLNTDEDGVRGFAKLCVRAGVTTATDLANLLSDETVEMLSRVTSESKFPARIVPLRLFQGVTPGDLVGHIKKLKEMSTDLLRLGRIKVVVDGSIQGFTARLKWPGYFNGSPQGLWYVSPDQLREVIELTLKENIQIHTHTNGDQATELVLDTLENALLKHPSNDHRFTLQHCQLANSSQFRRMKKLGLCVNLFANHLYYWGEEHYGKTVGPERAERMNSCKTALDNNVPLAIHSDAPVTPLGPLFTAWCAVNRQTISGRILGESERISIDQALRAITLGAAYTLKLDSEIGSIEVGKKADFAVLEDDPYDVSPENIKDIKVWGTVQSGRIFSAENI
ncbi:MAG: amidohydrolase [Paracoccaceae bacterium]